MHWLTEHHLLGICLIWDGNGSIKGIHMTPVHTICTLFTLVKYSFCWKCWICVTSQVVKTLLYSLVHVMFLSGWPIGIHISVCYILTGVVKIYTKHLCIFFKFKRGIMFFFFLVWLVFVMGCIKSAPSLIIAASGWIYYNHSEDWVLSILISNSTWIVLA